MSQLSITKSLIQGDVSVTVLHLNGQMDRITSKDAIDHARQVHEDGASHLLLDLTGVEMLTSSGLLAIQAIFKLFTPETDREIMRHHHEEPYKSPYMKLVCPDPKIYYILNIAGFLQNLLIYNNLDEAIKSFEG
jgi:hypothetical protein